MSSTKAPKKRGRPPGSKTKPKRDIVTKEPLGEPEISPADQAQATAVEDILKEAEEKATQIMQSEPDISGRSPISDPSESPAQADFMPGTRPPDSLYLPKMVYDENKRTSRPCALKDEYHYCFVEAGAERITSFKLMGYRFVLYDGGSLSGLAPGGFSGTGMFERTLDNHVRHGDTFLMYTDIRSYQALQAEERKKINDWNAAVKDSLHNEGYGQGVRTFEEVDGVQIYN